MGSDKPTIINGLTNRIMVAIFKIVNATNTNQTTTKLWKGKHIKYDLYYHITNIIVIRLIINYLFLSNYN